MARRHQKQNYCLRSDMLSQGPYILNFKINVRKLLIYIFFNPSNWFCICCFFSQRMLNYRPQTKFAKVMFLQVSVILSTGGGGVHGCSRGGMRGCSRGGCTWLLRGGVHAWLLLGVCGCSGGVRGFFDEIRSMSGQYASYWNAYLFLFSFISSNFTVKYLNLVRVIFNQNFF